MTAFKDKVYEIVKSIPQGKVVSYGQVALLAGIPRAARQVGWVMSQIKDNTIPWWRVINNKGYISIKSNEYSALEQKKHLEDEGVIVTKDFSLDIKKYRYIPVNIQELPPESLDKLFKLM